MEYERGGAQDIEDNKHLEFSRNLTLFNGHKLGEIYRD